MTSPFSSTRSRSGQGNIQLVVLPPSTPRLRTVQYQYPLKLVSPAPITADAQLVHTVYLLTYGGGIVAGDAIDLHIYTEARLTLLTQGSTKLFKSPSRDIVSKQCMNTRLAPGSALCYLPDPVQPFEHSCFEQQQIYDCVIPGPEQEWPSLCVLDWVSNGRSANGENWSFHRYASRNEIFVVDRALQNERRRLVLRDNLLLDDHDEDGSITARMSGIAICGTLIIYGPLFKQLGQFFVNEFKLQPRIGGRQWDDAANDQNVDAWREARQQKEAQQDFLWSAASIRGCVVVKFGAKELEHGRLWLYDMLRHEGTIINRFGERALLCLR